MGTRYHIPQYGKFLGAQFINAKPKIIRIYWRQNFSFWGLHFDENVLSHEYLPVFEVSAIVNRHPTTYVRGHTFIT